jgi:hypothetical protein
MIIDERKSPSEIAEKYAKQHNLSPLQKELLVRKINQAFSSENKKECEVKQEIEESENIVDEENENSNKKPNRANPFYVHSFPSSSIPNIKSWEVIVKNKLK